MAIPSVDPALFAELNEVLREHPRNEFRLAKLEKTGKALIRSAGEDRIRGYLFLGACAAARGNEEDALRYHQATLALSPGDVQLWNNLLVSMIVLWNAPKAREVSSEILERFRGNRDALTGVKSSLIEMGLLSSAAALARKASLIDEKDHWVSLVDDVLRSFKIDELQVSEAVRAARDSLRDLGFARPEFSCDALESDDASPGALAYGFHPPASSDSLTDVQRALFEAMAKKQLPAEESGAITFYVSHSWDKVPAQSGA